MSTGEILLGGVWDEGLPILPCAAIPRRVNRRCSEHQRRTRDQHSSESVNTIRVGSVWGYGRLVGSAAAAAAGTTGTPAAATATTTAARTTGTPAAAAAALAATASAGTAAALTGAAALTATAAGATTATTRHGARSGAKTMIGRPAVGVEHPYHNESDHHYEQGVLGGILAGLLAPKALEGG
jgi:hypothetical protein